jgi:IclR family acetate operon transcriptional repressor
MPLPEPAGRQAGGVQSVDRALDLIEVLAADGEAPISALAATTGLPLPTIHRLLRTLVGRGFVRQGPNRRYALGLRFLSLAGPAVAGVGSWARPALERVVLATGESAGLAIWVGDDAVWVARQESGQALRVVEEVGAGVPLHGTAAGKALLSLLDDDQARSLLRRTGQPALTGRTLTEPDTLLGELELVRGRGYAGEDGEHRLGVRGVAVPLRIEATSFALCAAGPAARMTDDVVARTVAVLCRVAGELQAELTRPG